MSPTAAASESVAAGAGHELKMAGGALRLGGRLPCRVMGILNVTGDSFSDGGRFFDPDAAVAHAEKMAEEGADVIDVGGESTRPGALPVRPEEQAARVVPVIARLAKRLRAPISIDTSSAEVARRAFDAGAQIINDVTALRGDPGMAAFAAETGAPVVLMHMLGTPRTMQDAPRYGDVVAEIAAFLRERIAAAERAGIDRRQIVLDPGFGFGKTLEHNLEILRRLGEFQDLGRPLLVGVSRKAMIGRLLDRGPDERLYGSLAAAAAAVERGAAMVRVHDVRPTVELARVLCAVLGRSGA